jgi:SAM-dependent methyltransferase
MYTKVIDLKEFYESVQGRVVQRILWQHMHAFWPVTRGLRIVGLGYAIPYLKPLMQESERVVALMPARQGAVFWPADEKGLVSIYQDGELPLETNSVDRILAIHAFQDFEGLDATLRECWRVLTGQGRLILIVPNRTGIWARMDSTPFGLGTPWSMGQLNHMLKESLFVPEKMERALFVPPSSSRLMLAMAPAWEKLGGRFCNAFGGVNIVEASKQLYAGTLIGASLHQRSARKQRIRVGVAPIPERSKSGFETNC